MAACYYDVMAKEATGNRMRCRVLQRLSATLEVISRINECGSGDRRAKMTLLFQQAFLQAVNATRDNVPLRIRSSVSRKKTFSFTYSKRRIVFRARVNTEHGKDPYVHAYCTKDRVETKPN